MCYSPEETCEDLRGSEERFLAYDATIIALLLKTSRESLWRALKFKVVAQMFSIEYSVLPRVRQILNYLLNLLVSKLHRSSFPLGSRTLWFIVVKDMVNRGFADLISVY